jgi:agmatine deiminase
VIWLESGVLRDETDGHVDNLCCFVKPGEVLLTWTDDRDDPQYEISRRALEMLGMPRRTPAGVALDRPQDPSARSDGHLQERNSEGMVRPARRPNPAGPATGWPASYVNFYIANGGIVMPLFDDRPRPGRPSTC